MKIGHFLLLLVCLLPAACDQSNSVSSDQTNNISVAQSMGATPDPGFARALELRDFNFPADHAAHPEYTTEWWYFTGNLQDAKGAAYGYQLTLFRVGLKPGEPATDSDWRSHQLYMGHLALSEIDKARHQSAERFARAAAGLAGARTQPLKIWLGPWSIESTGADLFPLQLTASTPQLGVNLQLQAGNKALVLQGDSGLSRKGSGAGNASYYYSYTRLPTRGKIRLGDQTLAVSGNSWFDREWSSSALAADQAGWDWFSLQLDDGRDLMFYRMRDKQGQAQAFSNGVLVGVDGSVIRLGLDSVQLDVLRQWQSPEQTTYPLSWRLQIPGQQIDLRIEAAFDDQEMRHTVRYWEGAVRVTGSHKGVGYMELSGYAP